MDDLEIYCLFGNLMLLLEIVAFNNNLQTVDLPMKMMSPLLVQLKKVS